MKKLMSVFFVAALAGAVWAETSADVLIWDINTKEDGASYDGATRNFDTIKAKAKAAWDYISNIKFPSFPSFGGGGGEKPQGNAMGTPYFRGGLTRVNERGGELINLPSGSQIIPHDLSRAAVSGSRSQNINITLNVAGNVIGNEDFYNQCGNAITERLTAALANM